MQPKVWIKFLPETGLETCFYLCALKNPFSLAWYLRKFPLSEWEKNEHWSFGIGTELAEMVFPYRYFPGFAIKANKGAMLEEGEEGQNHTN